MGNKLNKLLTRQLTRHSIKLEDLPADLQGLLLNVNQTYENYEDDILLLQNSIEISSQELRDAYQKHKDDAESRKNTLNKIQEAFAALTPAGQANKPGTDIQDVNSCNLFDALINLIEERRQAELERVKQAGLITSLLDSIPDLIFFKDVAGRYLGCNPSFAGLTGLTKSQIIGKNDWELFDKPFSDIYSRYDHEILLSRQPFHYEEYITTPEGKKLLLDTRKTLYCDSDGGLIGILGISRDITNRKEAEEALLNSSQKFEAIISASPDGIGMIALDGTLQLMSDKLAAMYGYSKEQKDEYLGKDFWRFIDPSNHHKLRENLQNLISGRSQEKITEYLAVKQDQTRFYVDVNSTVLLDSKGQPESILFIERDITERKRAEELALNERTLFRTIIDLIPDAVYVKDLEGRKIIANPKEVQFAGKNSEEEILGKTDFELYHNREANRGMDEDRQVLQSGNPMINIDGTLIDKDGRFHWILCSKVPLRDVHGKIMGLVGISRDITEQKKSEAVLLKAKEAADVASQAKSEFLANMSHEIRTPLNGVIGFTDLLLKTPLNRTQQQYAENVNISGHSLLAIISDILDFSKIEAGKMELDRIKADIIELTEQTSDIIKYQAAQKGLELLLNVQPDMPRFGVVDPTRLKQVLVNLLGNAVKFTPAGEVELKVTFSPKDDVTGYFSFSVRDTGIGIDKEQQKKLFNAFTQADTSTTRKFGGTGLGLTISRMLVEKMGSMIEIESEVNKGSDFHFTIEAPYEKGEKIDPGNLTHIKRVLVIDDNANNRLILEHTFFNWGIEYTGAEDGYKALQLIGESAPFDVIIVDYNMPELNRIETIKRIRKQIKPGSRKLPAILLHSSSDNFEIYDECKRLGVRFNLTKPVKSQELLHYLSSIHSESATSNPDTRLSLPDQLADRANESSVVILVAEDVGLNMLLVTTLIKQMIPAASILEALNGKQALEITIAQQPDLILMDVQMPEMSGIEAARKIREAENVSGGHIPIIALTAGAIKGEKENCLKAGMDDFITKPIDRETLYKLLKKHLLPLPDKVPGSSESPTTDPKDLHFNARKLMDNIGNNQEFLEEILDEVPVQFSYDIQTLAKAIGDQDYAGIKSTAHSIKGAALNMYFNQLAETARTIELVCEEKNIDKLNAIFNELVTEWEQVHILLQDMKRSS